MEACTDVPFMQGSESFCVDVAGESFYPDSFAALCGEKTIEGVRIQMCAQLELQDDNPHDKQAVCVKIEGHQVGHLSRVDARAFRRLVRYGQMAEHEVFECAALIVGGWDHGPGDVGHFGVRLDLVLYDE